MQKRWFSSTPEIDQEILDKYEDLWQQAASGLLDDWCETPSGSLALVIVLDQFPLNMFRNQPKAYSTEQQAVKIARKAINDKQNREIAKDKIAFLYMPQLNCLPKPGLMAILNLPGTIETSLSALGDFPTAMQPCRVKVHQTKSPTWLLMKRLKANQE